MNVLVDYNGHTDLFYSFIQLFENRLGWTVYFPYGEEWARRGFVGQQYGLDSQEHSLGEERDGLLTVLGRMEPEAAPYEMRGLSFQRFLGTPIDVVVSSVYFNEGPFAKLVRAHKPGAVYIRQIANIHEKPLGFCRNFLIGAAFHPMDYGWVQDPEQAFRAKGLSCFVYYPEHHTGYHYTEPQNHKRIVCLTRNLFAEDMDAVRAAESALGPLGFTFELYGSESPTGGLCRVPHMLLPRTIKESAFVWYTKPGGGGGYTSRQALACGRPLILRRRYSSAHTSIECNLYRHGVNCVDLDLVRSGQGYDFSMLTRWSDTEMHRLVCEQTAKIFDADVQFAATAEHIGRWVESLPKGVA